ncbi:hypothetical protein EDD22DRAFT_596148 [Suillus occidentalis]|nr:hypothetical protein EDD22DRAFT_596148 [Suillus occidentalis]
MSTRTKDDGEELALIEVRSRVLGAGYTEVQLNDTIGEVSVYGRTVKTHSPALRAAKRASLMIALPLTFVISAVYWSLLLFFPSLILQRQLPGLSEPSSSSTLPELARIPLNIDLSLY